ncbi:hypothetical protein [Streptomyces sp. H27-C3]|uniref:hypothetical protein n=1 Tax=Streptomyces sp. H27-C3 TaxID=3046305 RepID=UPI0024BB8A1A|nr:hypothetical protein [Streptomyces sp. H27-C3]MDJ0460622.1 hypothetical protein [Streptomyces sp. H27-C3]
MPTRLDLFHRVLIGALAAAIATGCGYLILGQPPAWWVPMLGGGALILASLVWAKARRGRECRRLDEMYEAPALGDDH